MYSKKTSSYAPLYQLRQTKTLKFILAAFKVIISTRPQTFGLYLRKCQYASFTHMYYAYAINHIYNCLILRYMFWTDCGTEAKIERADLDGSERTTIITQDIRSPNAITIDFSEGRIYWVDGDLGTISSSRYSGEDRKTIPGHNSKTLEFLGVSLFRSDIYLTDSTLRSLAVGKKSPDQFRHRTFFTNPNSSLVSTFPKGKS